MLSALTELGRMGMTVIGRTAADAQHRFEAAQTMLLQRRRKPRIRGRVVA